MSVIAPGTPAPQFKLARQDGSSFSERDLLGQGTVLGFYPFAFSPVCTEQLQLYEGLLAELAEHDVKLYGVSCDSTWAQRAFAEKLGVSSEQLSDFEPKGAACRAFGVLNPAGFAERALIMIHPERRARFRHVAPSPAELPGLEVQRAGLSQASGHDGG